MREHLPHIAQFDSGRRNQVVNNPQGKLALNEHVPAEKQVEVLGYRSSQRVFNRDHRPGNGSTLYPVKNFR